MNKKLFATLVTTFVAAIAGFAIGFLGSSGSIGGWIAFPREAVGLLSATFLALTVLYTSSLLSFTADRVGNTWWMYCALSVVYTVLAFVILAMIEKSSSLITIEMLGMSVVVGVPSAIVYYFAERYANKKS